MQIKMKHETQKIFNLRKATVDLKYIIQLYSEAMFHAKKKLEIVDEMMQNEIVKFIFLETKASAPFHFQKKMKCLCDMLAKSPVHILPLLNCFLCACI
jgi:hypothetical protein